MSGTKEVTAKVSNGMSRSRSGSCTSKRIRARRSQSHRVISVWNTSPSKPRRPRPGQKKGRSCVATQATADAKSFALTVRRPWSRSPAMLVLANRFRRAANAAWAARCGRGHRSSEMQMGFLIWAPIGAESVCAADAARSPGSALRRTKGRFECCFPGGFCAALHGAVFCDSQSVTVGYADGSTYSSYVQRRRMERAALASDPRSITRLGQVCDASGCCSPRHVLASTAIWWRLVIGGSYVCSAGCSHFGGAALRLRRAVSSIRRFAMLEKLNDMLLE